MTPNNASITRSPNRKKKKKFEFFQKKELLLAFFRAEQGYTPFKSLQL